MELLDFGDDLTLEEAATQIVDGYHAVISPREIPPPPHPLMAYVTPFDNHVHFIAWQDESKAWVVHEKSHYGAWIPLNLISYWQFIEVKPDGRRTTKKVKDPITGETTEVPIELGPRPGEPGNNPDWNVGDKVYLGQKRVSFEIIATGDNCVLMKDIRTGELQADSNSSLERYYRREISHDVDF